MRHSSDQRKETLRPSGSRSPVKYLTVQEVTCPGAPAFGARLDALMEALLSLEAADRAIEDPDPTADMVKAQATLRRAIRAIGDATPGWETTWAVMHVTPAGAPEPLLTTA